MNMAMAGRNECCTSALVRKGNIVSVGSDYITDDNRVIFREYKGTRTFWRVEGSEQLHRSLWDAYYETDY